MITLAYYEMSCCQKFGHILTCGCKKYYAKPSQKEVDEVISMQAKVVFINVTEGPSLEMQKENLFNKHQAIREKMAKQKLPNEHKKWIR